jgi:hypothetical protein
MLYRTFGGYALGAVCAVVALGALAQPAQASMIMISTHSSDETPASVLDATMDFQVLGSTLTLTVTNDTTAPDEYLINQLYFNGTDNVSGLTPVATPEGWSYSTGEQADGFGTFDFALIDGVGGDSHAIAPGDSLTFTFTISGAGYTDIDFTSDFSTNTNDPMVVAAKFIVGPGDDSAFGATNEPVVPAAPGVAIFLGLLATGRRRRA